jgi:hypothetical protein
VDAERLARSAGMTLWADIGPVPRGTDVRTMKSKLNKNQSRWAELMELDPDESRGTVLKIFAIVAGWVVMATCAGIAIVFWLTK